MYEIFVQLCEEHCVTPYRVSKETGVSQAALSTWKSGANTPRNSTLKKIADYFGVTLSYLKGESKNRLPGGNPGDRELEEYLNVLRNRSECRMLFSVAKDASKEDIQRAVAIIEALRKADSENAGE